MADLFLDIRDRCVRALVIDGGAVCYQLLQNLPPASAAPDNKNYQADTSNTLKEGELSSLLAHIKSEARVRLDQAHVIVPSSDVTSETHRLPLMPKQDAQKLISRKTAEKTRDESSHVNLTAMGTEQDKQEWLAEHVSVATLKIYKKEFSTAGIKLKTVSTALASTLHAISGIRESIFNAQAVFEINESTIEAYYISASSLLLHETLLLSSDDESKQSSDKSRTQKKREFTILDLLYRVNTQYLAAYAMSPLQKVWLCGTDTAITDFSTVLQDAMDVETGMLADADGGAFVVLNGFVKAYQDGSVVNLIHPDMLRRFPLRKRSGMLTYVISALLAAVFVITTETRHNRLNKQNTAEKKELAAQKASHAASAAFVKNLDLLRKLTGSQVTLYPIFKELAISLPEGVFLDSFSYVSKDNRDTIDLSASFPQSGDLGSRKTLTGLSELLNRSAYLNHHSEPTITSTTIGTKKIMTVKFTCEVTPRDTAK